MTVPTPWYENAITPRQEQVNPVTSRTVDQILLQNPDPGGPQTIVDIPDEEEESEMANAPQTPWYESTLTPRQDQVLPVTERTADQINDADRKPAGPDIGIRPMDGTVDRSSGNIPQPDGYMGRDITPNT